MKNYIDDIKILKISETDYEFILNMEKIEENYIKNNYEPKSQQSTYLYVILCDDEDNYDFDALIGGNPNNAQPFNLLEE